MPTPLPTAEPTSPAACDDDDAHFQSILRTLVDQGAKLVTDLTDDPTLPAAAKAAPYQKFTTSIRRSIALHRHIAADPPARPTKEATRARARREILRDVAETIENRAETPERAESLHAELHERLDDPAFERDLLIRTVPDLIREITEDFGLADRFNYSYPRRTPADIRALEARAAAPPRPPCPDFLPPPHILEAEIPQHRPNPLLDRYRHHPDDG